LEPPSLNLFELWLASDIVADNFSFSYALLLCVERVWLCQLLEVADDSEYDGERNGGWRTTIWICYGGFVQVQDESDNGGIGRRWICWVNQRQKWLMVFFWNREDEGAQRLLPISSIPLIVPPQRCYFSPLAVTLSCVCFSIWFPSICVVHHEFLGQRPIKIQLKVPDACISWAVREVEKVVASWNLATLSPVHHRH